MRHVPFTAAKHTSRTPTHSQGKNPWVVAKEEHRQMFLATLPYRFRMMVTEYEACKEKVYASGFALGAWNAGLSTDP